MSYGHRQALEIHMAIAQSLDHFVVPVDDLVVAEDFYARVFGGMLGKRNGLNVRQRKRGAVPHTFVQIGGKRMGVYLQSDERPPAQAARAACRPIRSPPRSRD